MTFGLLIAVGVGGAFGAVARYVTMSAVSQLTGSGFPWGTLVVNLFGSIILAILIEVMALRWSPSPEMRAALVVGVMGSFTTFSTFSMDTYLLYERGHAMAAGGYVLGSVVLCLIGFWMGLKIMRVVLT